MREKKLSARRTTPGPEMLSGEETCEAATVRRGGSTATPEKESNVTARYEKLLSKLRRWMRKKPGFKT